MATQNRQNSLQHKYAHLAFLGTMICLVIYSIFGKSLLMAVASEHGWLAANDFRIREMFAMWVSFFMFVVIHKKKGLWHASLALVVTFLPLYLFIEIDASIPPFAGTGKITVPIWVKVILAVTYIFALTVSAREILSSRLTQVE